MGGRVALYSVCACDGEVWEVGEREEEEIMEAVIRKKLGVKLEGQVIIFNKSGILFKGTLYMVGIKSTNTDQGMVKDHRA